MSDKYNPKQFWIFQGNPKKYAVDAYLRKFEYVYCGLKQKWLKKS